MSHHIGCHRNLLLSATLLLFSLPAFAVDIIVDNQDAGETNTYPTLPWIGFNNTTAFRGYAGRTTVNTAWSKYVFGSGLSGEYDIYMWWPTYTATLPDTTVTITIKPVGTAETVVVNQRINDGQWNLLGRYALNSTAFVTITNDGGGVVLSDAVKLVPFVPPPPPPAPTATLSAAPLEVDTGGTTTATWASVGSPSVTDWIGLYTLGITPADGVQMGFDIGVNDDDGIAGTTRDSQLMWHGDNFNYQSTELYGHATVEGTPVGTPPPPPPPPGPLSALAYGINTQAMIGTFDAAGKAFTEDLAPTAIRLGPEATVASNLANVDWADARNIDVLYHLGYSGNCGTPTIAANRQCYAAAAAARALTFAGKVKWFQVWNEWNGGLGLGGGWMPVDSTKPSCTSTAVDANGKPVCPRRSVNNQTVLPQTNAIMYTDLLCRTYAAIKAAVPTALIVGPVTAGTDYAFHERAAVAGAGACTDVVDVHPYIYGLGRVPVGAPASVAVDKFAAEIGLLKSRLLTKGMNKPIMVSEEGVKSLAPWSEAIQAAYITELYRRAPAMPGLVGIWLFTIEDWPGTLGGDGWGILRSNNTKKLGYAAFKAATPKP